MSRRSRLGLAALLVVVVLAAGAAWALLRSRPPTCREPSGTAVVVLRNSPSVPATRPTVRRLPPPCPPPDHFVP